MGTLPLACVCPITMTESFIPAEKLKQQYFCLGHFYRLVLENAREFPCRSVLEILKTDKFAGFREKIADSHSDALVIMMNPGSSHPLSPTHEDRGVAAGAIRTMELAQPLVPTVPDTTQYQVMRLMTIQNWDHVRVVNLSDLRNPNSVDFLQTASRVKEIPGGSVHSIFSIERQKEWGLRLSMNRGPVIAGWGQSPRLVELAERCIQSMGRRKLFGVQAPGHPLRFAHPSPRNHAFKLRWLTDINNQLSMNSSNR